MFRVKNVPMFRDFAPKMNPCLGILLQKQVFFFLGGGFWGQKWDPCLGIFVKNRPIWAAHPRIAKNRPILAAHPRIAFLWE